MFIPELKLTIDENLWVSVSGCDGLHYLVGNAQTHYGRFSVFCPEKKKVSSASLGELRKMSYPAILWINGFLHGNTPQFCDAAVDNDAVELVASETYQEYLKNCEQFVATGQWPVEYNENECIICHQPLDTHHILSF